MSFKNINKDNPAHLFVRALRCEAYYAKMPFE